jgi:hypothetical protein
MHSANTSQYISVLLCVSTRVFVDPSSASMFSTAQVKDIHGRPIGGEYSH